MNNVISPSAPKSVCNDCNSTGHLTHACKKVKPKTKMRF